MCNAPVVSTQTSQSPARRGIERLIAGLAHTLEFAHTADLASARRGWLQTLDPRAKLLACLTIIASCILSHNLWVLASLFGASILLAKQSQLSLSQMAKQFWLGVLILSGLIALPAIFVVPGKILWHSTFLNLSLSAQGLKSAAFLILRAETSASFAGLLILTTPWPQVLKSLRSLGCPVVLVAILGMTHRYIFVLLQTAMQMFEARRARTLAPLNSQAARKLAIASVGVLLDKSLQLSSEVHLAMISRGYRGEIRLLTPFHYRTRDWVCMGIALALPLTIGVFQA